MTDKSKSKAKPKSATAADLDLRYGSNAIRLTGRQWLAVGIALVAACAFVPAIWASLEPFDVEADYRVPYALSNDYWHYKRYCGKARRLDRTLLIGDSVVWGEYVAPNDTLSHYLNRELGEDRFLNLGVNGAHPAALDGLLDHYGGAIRDENVVLHFNPLWMTSKRHDLQSEKEFGFNHPDLVPQFFPRIPCYGATNEERLGVVMGRLLPFSAFTKHISLLYFDNTDVPTWVQDNPYENPLARVTLELPKPETDLRHEPVPWTERGIQPSDLDWVEASTSLQWRFFRESVELLQSRGNNVYVLVGPFNEHMLTEQGLAAYQDIKKAVVAWLDEQGIPYWAPDALPSELYADASHPLAEGYALEAQRLLEQPAFRTFIGAGDSATAGAGEQGDAPANS